MTKELSHLNLNSVVDTFHATGEIASKLIIIINFFFYYNVKLSSCVTQKCHKKTTHDSSKSLSSS